MRIAYWDIETSNLKGDIGRILCASVLDGVTGEMTSFRNDELSKSMANDKQLAKKLRDELEKYHLTIGWFSKGFDITFLNTRLVKHRLKTIRPHLHLDPIWYCKGWRGLNARSAKMKVMSEFFGCEPKPDVPVDVWTSAFGGDRKAIDILVNRCEADVRITQEITLHLLDTGLIKNIQTYP